MKRRLLIVLAILLGVAFAAPFCFHLLRDPDTGWHLALGRMIGSTGIPRRNALAWTALDQPWYPTSWLYDWMAAAIVGRWNLIGLQGLTLGFVAAALTGMALACNRVNPAFGKWMTPLAGLILIPRISERPHMATFVLLAFVMWLCVGSNMDWRRRLACVPLIALGSNFHAGSAFPASALGLFCTEAFFFHGRKWRELAIATAGVAALMANPGGSFIVRYLIDNFHHADVIAVTEMAPPTFSTEPWFFIALPIGILSATWTARRSPALLATTLMFALLGLKAIRLTWDYELVAVVAAAQALVTVRYGFLVPAVATVVLFVARVPMYQSLPIGSSFDAAVMPVHAAEFVRNESIAGRAYNAIGDGGYLEWALSEHLWFQDSRAQAYPPAFFQDEQAAEHSADTLRNWVAREGAEWAITSRLPVRMSGYMQFESPEWALVYWDETSEVWLRRDVERFASLIARLEYRRFRPQAPVAIMTVDVPELMLWDGELRRFEVHAPNYPAAAVLRCAVVRRLGGDSTAACAHAEKLATTPQLRDAFEKVRKLPRAG